MLDPLEGDDTGTVFRDTIMLALAGFVALVILMLPYLNPEQTKTAENTEPPGNVIVEVRWPDELDTDIDLWVQAPVYVPVGYSNKGGVVFNLLRDDLGRRADATKMNYEVTYSRGLPPGEYVVNLHLYRNMSHKSPIRVTVVASVKKSAQESARQLVASEVNLRREGQELTVFRFRLNERGDLVPGSVNSLNRPLRSAKVS